MSESHSPLISAVVPVYRCEQTLPVCVESVLGQSFTDWELILVDDGSPDKSGDLCDAYAKKDERIRVVHKENGGTSSARNAGIGQACGGYLMFLDNDDRWTTDGVLAEVAQRIDASSPDLLTFLHEEYWVESGKVTMPVPCLAPRKGAPHYPLSENGDFYESTLNLVNEYVYSGAVWQCAFKRSMVEEGSIRFPEGRRNEDLAFCFDVLMRARSVDFINEPLYQWRRGESSSQSAGIPARDPALDLAAFIVEWARRTRLADDRRQKVLEAYLGPIYAVWMGYAYLYDDEEMVSWRKRLKPYAYLLKGSSRKDVGLIRRLSGLLGQGLTGRLLALRYHLLALRS